MSHVQRSIVAVCAVAIGGLGLSQSATADFATSAASYTQGTVEPAVTGYNNPATATGQPSRIAGASFAHGMSAWLRRRRPSCWNCP